MLARVRSSDALVLALLLLLAAPSVAYADPDWGRVLGGFVAIAMGVPLSILWAYALVTSDGARAGSARLVAFAAPISVLVWVTPISGIFETWRAGRITTFEAATRACASAHSPSWTSSGGVSVTLEGALAADWPLAASDVAFVRDASPDTPAITGTFFERPDGGTYLISMLVTPRVLSLDGRFGSRVPHALASIDAPHDASASLVGDALLISSASGVDLLDASLERIAHADAVSEPYDIAAEGDVLWTIRQDGAHATIRRVERGAPARTTTLAERATMLFSTNDGALLVQTFDGVLVLDGTTLAPRRPSLETALSNLYAPSQVQRLLWAFPASIVLTIAALIQIGHARRAGALSPARRRRLFFVLSPIMTALLIVSALVFQATS
jgi:hypothetical protein